MRIAATPRCHNGCITFVIVFIFIWVEKICLLTAYLTILEERGVAGVPRKVGILHPTQQPNGAAIIHFICLCIVRQPMFQSSTGHNFPEPSNVHLKF